MRSQVPLLQPLIISILLRNPWSGIFMGIKMRRIRRRYVILLCFVIFLLVLGALGVVYINRKAFFPSWYAPKKFTGNIFGKPNAKADYEFPANKPEFVAKTSSIKSPSLEQQSVTVYKIVDEKKTPVFQRQFYADGFRGKVLTYSVASDSASIRQSGSLGTIGCGYQCALVWSNFYVWDPQQKIFTLDNSSHKDFFKQMLITYQSIDKRGCSAVGNDVVPNQTGISLTELYTKHPTLKWYCSPTRGILPASLIFFLKAEKAAQQIIDGKNIGSDDINDVSLEELPV